MTDWKNIAGSQFSVACSKMFQVHPHRSDMGLNIEGGHFVHVYTFLIVIMNNKINNLKITGDITVSFVDRKCKKSNDEYIICLKSLFFNLEK